MAGSSHSCVRRRSRSGTSRRPCRGPTSTTASLRSPPPRISADPQQIGAVRSLLALRHTGPGGRAGVRSGASPPSPLRHNCSGNPRFGFLALCRVQGWDSRGYRLRDNSAGKAMLAEVAAAAELREDEIPTAIDGCGVVTFALPWSAWHAAVLAPRGVNGGGHGRRDARAHPALIRGPGAPDTVLMETLPGWIASGAEGLLCGADPGPARHRGQGRRRRRASSRPGGRGVPRPAGQSARPTRLGSGREQPLRDRRRNSSRSTRLKKLLVASGGPMYIPAAGGCGGDRASPCTGLDPSQLEKAKRSHCSRSSLRSPTSRNSTSLSRKDKKRVPFV